MWLATKDAGTAVGQGGRKTLRAMETYREQKNPYQLRLLLFNNHVDPLNNKEKYRKNSFQFDLDKP